jgi:hypothetical protein
MSARALLHTFKFRYIALKPAACSSVAITLTQSHLGKDRRTLTAPS